MVDTLNGDCCIARALYLATSRDARDLDSCYESFDLCLFRWVEGGPEGTHDHASFACHLEVQHRLDVQRNSLGCMYRYLDRLLGSQVVEVGVEVGHLMEAAQDEGGGDCLREVVADVMSRWCGEVVAIEVYACRDRFAMLAFLLAEGYRVKEDASRKLVLAEEESFGRGVDLCDRSQNNHLEDRSCDHHQHPRLRPVPCQQFHRRGQGAWQHVFRGAFCGQARVTLRNGVDPQGGKEAGEF
jgi:hypothetical protein